MLTVKIEVNGKRIATLTARQTLMHLDGVAEYEWRHIEKGIGGKQLSHYRKNGALALTAKLIDKAELQEE